MPVTRRNRRIAAMSEEAGGMSWQGRQHSSNRPLTTGCSIRLDGEQATHLPRPGR
jgi:hypothetical protein